MKHSVWLAATLAAVMCMGAGVQAAEKYAVVDLDRVMKAFGETKTAESLLQKRVDDYELEKEELQQKLEAMKKEFEVLREEAENKMLSEAAREKKIEAAKEKLLELRKYEREVRDTLGDRKRELTEHGALMSRKIVGKLQDKVKAYAEENGIVLVFDAAALGAAGAQVILHADDSVDITADILKLTAEE